MQKVRPKVRPFLPLLPYCSTCCLTGRGVAQPATAGNTPRLRVVKGTDTSWKEPVSDRSPEGHRRSESANARMAEMERNRRHHRRLVDPRPLRNSPARALLPPPKVAVIPPASGHPLRITPPLVVRAHERAIPQLQATPSLLTPLLVRAPGGRPKDKTPASSMVGYVLSRILKKCMEIKLMKLQKNCNWPG
jgi:hypothetical protein